MMSSRNIWKNRAGTCESWRHLTEATLIRVGEWNVDGADCGGTAADVQGRFYHAGFSERRLCLGFEHGRTRKIKVRRNSCRPRVRGPTLCFPGWAHRRTGFSAASSILKAAVIQQEAPHFLTEINYHWITEIHP